MTPATVTSLPRPATKAAQLEPLLVGAALALGVERSTFELLAITGEEMHVELHRKAWQISRARAERALPVTVADVWAAGLKAGWFHGGEGGALEQLAKDNKLDLAGLKRIGSDFRSIVEGERYVALLGQAIQRVRAQGYDAATEGGFLDATTARIRAQGAQLELMTAAQERFNESWRARAASGRKMYVPLGIPCFDEMYGGAPESVTVVVGDGGAGKTGFLDSLLESMLLAHQSTPETKAVLISPEDGLGHIFQRWQARDLGLRMRDVGSKKLTPAEEEQLQVVAGQHYQLFDRMLGWPHRGLTGEKLVQLCWQARNEGARIVGVDNFNKLLWSGKGDFWSQVARVSDALQECGERAGIAIVMLVHSTEDLSAQRSGDTSGGVHGGKGMPRDSRLRLDLYDKGGFLRMHVVKANALGPQGKVFQFERFAEAGLVNFASGGEVNLAQEKREEAEKKLGEQADLTLKRRAILKAKAPPKPEKPKAAESEPQSALDLEEANRKAKEAAVERPSGFGMRWTTETREEADE